MTLGIERNRACRLGLPIHLTAQRLELLDRIVESEQSGDLLEAFGDSPSRIARAVANILKQGLSVRRQPPGHIAPVRVVLQPGNRRAPGLGRLLQRISLHGMRIEQSQELPGGRVMPSAGAVIGEQPVHDLLDRGWKVRQQGQLPRAPDQRLVTLHANQGRPLKPRLRLQCRPFLAGCPDRRLLRQQAGDLLRVRFDPLVYCLERRRKLAGIRLQHLHELLEVVGQHHRPVPRPADLHVEGRLVGQRAVARVQHRDHPVRRDPLRCSRGVVLPRRAAEMPERVLHTLRQRREALAAEHNPGMGEARPDQAKVVEHVIQLLPGDGHTERPHAGEVGQTLLAGLVLLVEDHIPLGAVLGAPDADPPLQGSPHALAQLRMAAHQLLEHGDQADARAVLENRHVVRFEDIGQRIRTPPVTRLALRCCSVCVFDSDRRCNPLTFLGSKGSKLHAEQQSSRPCASHRYK